MCTYCMYYIGYDSLFLAYIYERSRRVSGLGSALNSIRTRSQTYLALCGKNSPPLRVSPFFNTFCVPHCRSRLCLEYDLLSLLGSVKL